MVYDKPIYVDSNNMLINANTPIKESDIKKLMTWGIIEVETAGTLVRRIETVERIDSKKNRGPDKIPETDSEKKIVTDYNELLKKRKSLIEVHSRARSAVDAAYKAIKNNTPFDTRDLEDSVQSIVRLLKENSISFSSSTGSTRARTTP